MDIRKIIKKNNTNNKWNLKLPIKYLLIFLVKTNIDTKNKIVINKISFKLNNEKIKHKFKNKITLILIFSKKCKLLIKLYFLISVNE